MIDNDYYGIYECVARALMTVVWHADGALLLQLRIEREKSSYKEAFAQLRELKSEIEHLQMLLEQSRTKLQKDFEQWMGVMLRQQMSAGQLGKDGRPTSASSASASTAGASSLRASKQRAAWGDGRGSEGAAAASPGPPSSYTKLAATLPHTAAAPGAAIDWSQVSPGWRPSWLASRHSAQRMCSCSRVWARRVSGCFSVSM